MGYKDLTNKRFGRLFVVRLSRITEAASDHRVYWLCWCDCGKEKEVRSDGLTSALTQSCGCLRAERAAVATKLACVTHGMTRTREYASWGQMKVRCNVPTNHKFPSYGGRGIRVCERWNSFANFYADMGPRPPGTSLDRIDNDGNYEPGNCRWADAKTQRNNRRDSVKVES